MKLQQGDPAMAAAKRKLEMCPMGFGQPLSTDRHSVAVFWVAEHKGRRGMITQLALNGPVSKETVPRTFRPSRLSVRQNLNSARYMVQTDFDAFYDAIPLPETVRTCFVL
jgi:hypothetical protein